MSSCSLQAGGVTEGTGFSEPAGIRLLPGEDDADVEGHTAAADVAVPPHYTVEVAQRWAGTRHLPSVLQFLWSSAGVTPITAQSGPGLRLVPVSLLPSSLDELPQQSSHARADLRCCCLESCSNSCLVPCRNAQALRDFARNWLPLLFNAFMVASGQERPRYAAAIAAYSMLTDATVLSHFFREVVKKLLKVRLLPPGSQLQLSLLTCGVASADLGKPPCTTVLAQLEVILGSRQSLAAICAPSGCAAPFLAWQAVPKACGCMLLSPPTRSLH